jgi:hypothetical protein
MEKGAGSLRTEMESLRTQMEKGSGSVKLWFVSTIGGTVVAFVTVLASVLHILGKI